MAKAAFERTKPHVNVGTIGHVDHGKTTLTAANPCGPVQERSGRNQAYADIAKEARSVMRPRRSRSRWHTSSTRRKNATTPTSIAPATPTRQEHDHRRRPDGRRHSRRFAADGPMPQTREHILLARQVGVPKIVVFLNKVICWRTPSSWNSSR